MSMQDVPSAEANTVARSSRKEGGALHAVLLPHHVTIHKSPTQPKISTVISPLHKHHRQEYDKNYTAEPPPS
jgi:hypothetical protein